MKKGQPRFKPGVSKNISFRCKPPKNQMVAKNVKKQEFTSNLGAFKVQDPCQFRKLA